MSARVHDPVSRVSYAFTRNGDDLYVETWMEPGGGLPAHWHPRQQEVWFAIDGKVEFRLGSDKRVIGPEDGEMVVEPETLHAVKAVEDRTVHLGCRVTPALDLEGFLTESAAAANEGLFMKGGIPKGLKGARWAADFLDRYGEETVMAFPPQIVQKATRRLFAGRGSRPASATMGGDAH